MDRKAKFYKNLTLYSAVFLGMICLFGSMFFQRTLNGGLMGSFFVEIPQFADLGKIKAWENEEEGLYYVFLPAAVDSEYVEVSLGTAFSEFEVELQKTEQTEETIVCKADKTYVLSWKIFGKVTVKEYSLMFVTGENIPALILETENGRSFKEDTKGGKEKYQETCRVKIIDENGQTLHDLSKVTVKGRGNTTWEAAKKPLKLELQEKESLFSMAPDDTYNLVANAFDGSHMRNKIMLDLANEISDDYQADGEWVELYYNGEYEGLYLLTEKVEIAENRLDIPSLQEENEKINQSPSKYREFSFEENYHGMTIKGIEIPNTPENISGSYLLEMDLRIRYEEADCGLITEKGQAFGFSSPDYPTRQELCYIADVIADVESALYAEDGISEISGKHLEELIDLSSFADVWLYGEISGEQDTGISSQYIYKLPDAESTLLYAGPIWDFDGSMGNTRPDLYAYPQCLAASKEEVRGSETGISNKWFAALWNHECFREKVKERYETVFHDKVKEVITRKIPVYTEIIQKSVTRDRLRWHQDAENWPFIWPDGYAVSVEEVAREGYHTYDRLDTQVKQITDFLAQKSDFLYDLWVNGTTYYEVSIKPKAEFLSDTMYYGRYYWVKEGEKIPEPPYYTSEWYPEENYERKGFFLSGTQKQVDITAPVYEDMEIIDVWEKVE